MRTTRLLAKPFDWQWLAAALVLMVLCTAAATLPFIIGGWGH
jgi:hypothetical protein